MRPERLLSFAESLFIEQLSSFDHVQRKRKPTAQPRGGDATVRFVLTHPEPPNTKVVERRARRLEIEPPLLHFAEVRE